MSTGAWILIVILAAVAGAIGGFFIARRTMMNYFVENPPFDEDMIRSMMTQMGIRYNVIFLQVIHIHNLDRFLYRVHRTFESELDRNWQFLLLLAFDLQYRLGHQYVHAFSYV